MITTALLIATLHTAAPGQIGLEVVESNGALLVQSVDPAGPAARFAHAGDTLVSVDKIPTPNRSVYDAIVGRIHVGDTVIVVLTSDGVTLGHRIKAIAPRADGEVAIIDHTGQDAIAAAPAPHAAAPVAAAAPAPTAAPTAAKTEVAPKYVEPETPFVFSAFGNTIGTTAVGMGFGHDGSVALGELRIVSRFTELLSVDAAYQSNITSNILDTGVRFTIIDRDNFAFAARAMLTTQFFLTAQKIALSGVGGGVMASFGNGSFSGTAGLDVTSYNFVWVEDVGNAFGSIGYSIKPYAGIEFTAVKGVALYAHGYFQALKSDDFEVVSPGFSFGVTY